MAKLIELEMVNTYASKQNAVKAFEKYFGNRDVRYMVLKNEDGRYYPVALGEKAIQQGVHFRFHVVC